jgi:integrase
MLMLKDCYVFCKGNTWTPDKGGSDSALRHAESALDRFGERTYVEDIDSEGIDRWIVSLRERGNCGGTINRKLSALSSMLDYAVRRQYINHKPFIQWQSESKERRIRWLSKAEEGAAVLYMDSHGLAEHADMLVMLVDTGLRPSELWRVQAQDFDTTSDRFVMRVWDTKTKQPRSIPLTARASDIMRRWFERQSEWAPEEKLFPDFTTQWFGRGWDEMRKALGFATDKHFIPYMLRHTCASRLVQSGVPIQVVQVWLGHKTFAMTLRYAHLSPANLLEAVKVLEAS